MAGTRRLGSVQSATRGVILDAARDLMIEEGYAAVTARKVAAKAGLKPALVQYYFPTMDALLLELYRHNAQAVLARQEEALASARPLHALWALTIDKMRAALGVEFLALASHRKEIRAEIALYAARTRELQAQALARLVQNEGFAGQAEGLALIIAAIGRALVMEQGVGIGSGHEQALAMVTRWLDAQEPGGQEPGAN